MCGIFGYANYFICVSHKHILNTLVTGLRRLEYRGYDSAGLAVDSTTPPPAHPDTDPNPQPTTAAKHDVLVIKSVGSVNKLEASVAARLDNPSVDHDIKLDRHVGVAHTRWATHGAPSTLNSHPHVSDPSAQFVVVHNGIITNYKPLKEMLMSKGMSFDSDTDTEVIAKLTKYLYETVREDDKPLPFPRLIMNVMHQMDGAYALLIKSTAYPNQLIACKVGSPLVMGMKPSNHEEEIAVIRSSITDNAPKSTNGSHHNGSHAANPNMIGATNGKAAPATTNGRDQPKNATTEMEYFLSSDASAIVEHTDKVVYFEDNDLVHIDQTGELTMFSVGNFETTRAIASNRAIATLDMELEQIMKGSYPHFMLKEIFEQPESLTQTMRGRVIHGSMSEREAVVPGMADVHLGGLSQRIGDLRRSSRIIFVACGTSFHSCLAARQVMEELTELPVSIELASDFLDRQTPLFRSDVCVFVSQSGETADTLEALRYAKRCQALTVGIVNVVGSSIARLTDCGVHTNAGAEIGVASTKAYTSQIMVMVIIALQLSLDSRAKQMRRRQIHKAMIELPSLVKRTLSEMDDRMKTVAERLRENSSILLFGRGYQYATCLEGALKIKEVSYIHTEGIHAGELKHGPLALIDENMPVILFASHDACATKVQNALHQVLARGGFSNMIIVGTEGDAEIERYREKAELILVPKSVDCLQAVLNIIPMQLLSYHLAVARGLNVDQPR